MRNLLKETIECLQDHGKTTQDVIWCGSSYGYFNWDHFKKISDFDYDSGYGGQEIIYDLKIVGSDFWLERGEYDGAEWWEFKRLPKKPDTEIQPNTLYAPSGWCTLKRHMETQSKDE